MPTATIQEPTAQRLARLQRALGITADGILGPETLTALEALLLSKPQIARTAFSLEISRTGLDQLVAFEVTSKTYYERKLRRPTWPGGDSGVTIGIGYDIGMTVRRQIESDWRGAIADTDLARLLTAQGTTGTAAQKLTTTLADISIPFDVAADVFYRSTVPLYARLTLDTYPSVVTLPADAQAMLLSLIYNRGTKLSGSRRQHMAALKPLIAGGRRNLRAIAEQVELMTELWPTSAGLKARRRKEAAMIRTADRAYDADELIRV